MAHVVHLGRSNRAMAGWTWTISFPLRSRATSVPFTLLCVILDALEMQRHYFHRKIFAFFNPSQHSNPIRYLSMDYCDPVSSAQLNTGRPNDRLPSKTSARLEQIMNS